MSMKKKKAAAVPAKASTPRIGQKNISEMWEADQEYMPPDVESDPRWRGVYLLGVTSAIGYVEMAFGPDRAHPKGWRMVDQLRLEAQEAVGRLSPFETASSTPHRDQSPQTSTITDAGKRSRKVAPVEAACEFLKTQVTAAVQEFGVGPTLEALGIIHGTALDTSVDNGDITVEQLDALIERTVDLATTSELNGVQIPPASTRIAKSEPKECGIPSDPQTPERFGLAISGQCAKPLGDNQYCVRAKHHDEALRCSALEKDADSNVPEEIWGEIEQITLAEKGRIDPTSKTFFFIALDQAVWYVDGLFEEGATKQVIRNCMTTFREDALAAFNAEAAKQEDAELAHLLSRMRPHTRRQ